MWYQLHNQTGAYVNYGDDGLQRLDYVVSQAEKLGLKLVIPFVNNWPDYGGFALYASIYGAQPNFYENKKSQEVYRDYIKVIVSRYRNSSAIFAWQLCNEPRCSACNTSVIYKWATDTSKYIKSLDPNHMVSLGDEGWFALSSGYSDEDGTSSHAYSGGNGVDFVANLNISTLDYHTFHLYPSWWNYPFSWGNHWIRQHADAGAKVRSHRPRTHNKFDGDTNAISCSTTRPSFWRSTAPPTEEITPRSRTLGRKRSLSPPWQPISCGNLARST